ncbi:putative secreted protein [Labilithrix luteola]|uniref:Putative secreted protein n=1 Tax=Labilithrix luteola TaxID=1391654 RepID=A0A0K1QEV7_9BACT|nr:redoxin family protein [Labilithrix luteola]AKV04202.1 putative secreted protein [Labilithrix luteola]
MVLISRSLRPALFGLVLSLAVGCTPSRAPETPALTLADTSGASTTLPGDLARSKLTVLVFYADHCPCFRVHEERIKELDKAYGPKGVRFLLVDSEVEATLERDTESARERSLPPIAIDPGAKLADALGAQYATYSVVLDEGGRVRYRGGLDTDKNRLTNDAKPYLRDALDDLLAGRDPRVPEGKALGCALQTR